MSDTSKTLDNLLTQQAQWSDEDLAQIIKGLREQRDRWSVEQSAGSRKRVPAKHIQADTDGLDISQLKLGTTKKPKPQSKPATLKKMFENLKL